LLFLKWIFALLILKVSKNAGVFFHNFNSLFSDIK